VTGTPAEAKERSVVIIMAALTMGRPLCFTPVIYYLFLGVVDSSGTRKHKFNRNRQVAPMCRHGRHIGANW